MGDTWVLWLLLLVPIAAQVPLLLYLMRNIEIEDAPSRAASDIWGVDGQDRWEEARPDHTAETAGPRCRHCGAENEPGYRYCAQCAKRL